jgi:HAD superfamily hydrolase (TIGR01549 family)
MMQNLIFDFDGTLANTLPLIISLVEQWSITDEKFSVEKIEQLRDMPAQEAMKAAGIPLRKLPGLITRGRKELLEKLDKAKPFNKIPDTVEKLAENHTLFVMSSNSDENIRHFLNRYDMQKHFKAIYGGVSIFGKKRMLKKILREQKLDPKTCVYIGDETRDIEAAYRTGLPVIAVAWGYNSKRILSVYQPNYLVHEPEDLLKVIEGST